MFTGIVREVGVVAAVEAGAEGARVSVDAPRLGPSLVPGGSIAVDGVCLTATRCDGARFSVDVVPETLDRTRLGELEEGARVNLELPLTLGSPLDGHLVQGHVDGVGRVSEVLRRGTQTEVTVTVTDSLAPFLAEKGSVAMNGVSLTITDATDHTFSVALIPTTLKETNLNELKAGSPVNLEVDLLARYAARWASRAGEARPRSAEPRAGRGESPAERIPAMRTGPMTRDRGPGTDPR